MKRPAVTLLAPVRRAPPPATRENLIAVLNIYGIKKVDAARMMGVNQQTLSNYITTLPKRLRPLPRYRWERLLDQVRELHHPLEDIEL